MNSTIRYVEKVVPELIRAIERWMDDGKTLAEARDLVKPTTCAGPAVWARVDAYFAEDDGAVQFNEREHGCLLG